MLHATTQLFAAGRVVKDEKMRRHQRERGLRTWSFQIGQFAVCSTLVVVPEEAGPALAWMS